MNCAVTIKSTNGEDFKSDGKIDYDGARLTVDYRLGGDLCRLTVLGGEARQTRCGNVDLDIPFSEGKTTFATIGSGENLGKFPVFTKSLEMMKSPFGFAVKLCYILFDEEVNLSFVAAYTGGNL